eukprot:754282-Hanusia_phi.AAC.2
MAKMTRRRGNGGRKEIQEEHGRLGGGGGGGGGGRGGGGNETFENLSCRSSLSSTRDPNFFESSTAVAM